MNAQSDTMTVEQRRELLDFAEKGLLQVQAARAEVRRHRVAHALAVQELGVLRMALNRADAAAAIRIVETLIRHHAEHAHEMRLEPFPERVIDLFEAREARAVGPLLDGGAA